MIEVYPRGTELVEVPGDADAKGLDGSAPRPHSPTHFAIGTQLTADQIFAIARREGWPAKYRKRGGQFGVIEVWIEGWRMIEVLTPEMQQEYLALGNGLGVPARDGLNSRRPCVFGPHRTRYRSPHAQMPRELVEGLVPQFHRAEADGGGALLDFVGCSWRMVSTHLPSLCSSKVIVTWNRAGSSSTSEPCSISNSLGASMRRYTMRLSQRVPSGPV